MGIHLRIQYVVKGMSHESFQSFIIMFYWPIETFPQIQLKMLLLMTSAVSKLFNPSWQASLVLNTLLLLGSPANEMYNQTAASGRKLVSKESLPIPYKHWPPVQWHTWVCVLQLLSSNFFRFSRGFKSGDCDGHCIIFQDFFCNQALVEFEVCLRSLSCRTVK